MKNVWLNRKKNAALAHLTYGCGTKYIELPVVYSICHIQECAPDTFYVWSLFDVESDRKLIWFDQDLFILDGVHYRKNGGFFSAREKSRGVFFTLKEIKDDYQLARL